jgi:hypothetical protein
MLDRLQERGLFTAGAVPAPIRPRCLLPSGPATAWHVSAQHSARRCMISPWWPPTGCANRSRPIGSNALANAWRHPVDHKGKPRARPMPHRLALMAYSGSTPSLMKRLLAGYAQCP